MDLDPLLPGTYQSNVELPDELIITVDSVEKQLLKTRLQMSIGPDQIPNWILKDLAGIIATPICLLFNSSLRDSYVPTIWKSANVCPLPKSKPIQNLKKDLRTISLTTVIAKMMEYYPIQHMRNTCQVVDPNQFGAVRRSSITLALLQILQELCKATPNRLF